MPFIIIIIILIIVIASRVFSKKNSSHWKGKYSETLVNNKLSGLPDEYIILNDLLFSNNGRSTQIDHVIVSPYAVFVIETKGFKGWILGGENSEYWTQTIYSSKHKFYNPIKQNEGHVKFLRYLLKCTVDIPFIPIVVFNNSANLKVYVKDHIVINRNDLLGIILRYRTPVLNPATIKWIVKTLQDNQIVADYNNLGKHIHNTQNQQYKSKNLIKHEICPQCGGQLVLRQGRFGKFYGCSNYPKCKFTLNRS